ncbi:hypothetical protein ACFIJ5_10740 [Haloimpatiens sp. FM7330]|uniref:hypothetical protein n=1 Tax=Haloimpatiens sp. FM7330 TaxID=3298610 RepID=UPI00362A8779
MNYLEKHFTSGIIEHRSEIEQKDYDDYMNQDNFIKLHAQLKELCKMNDVNFFEINDDYEEKMNNIYKWIDEQVKAKQRS